MSERVKMGLPPANASINCLISWICVKGDYEAAEKKAEELSRTLKGWRRYTTTCTHEGRAVSFAISIALLPVCYYGAKYFLQRRKMIKTSEMKKTE